MDPVNSISSTVLFYSLLWSEERWSDESSACTRICQDAYQEHWGGVGVNGSRRHPPIPSYQVNKNPKYPGWMQKNFRDESINIACAIYIIRFISMILCRCGSQISFEWGIFLYILPSQLVTILCTVWIEFWGSNWCAVQSKHCKDSWHTDTHITHIVVEWWQHSTELSGALNEFRKVVALNIFNQPTDGPRVRNI